MLNLTWTLAWFGHRGAARFCCFARCGRWTWDLRSHPSAGDCDRNHFQESHSHQQFHGLRQQFRRTTLAENTQEQTKSLRVAKNMSSTQAQTRADRVRMIYWQIFSQQPDGPLEKYDACSFPAWVFVSTFCFHLVLVRFPGGTHPDLVRFESVFAC